MNVGNIDKWKWTRIVYVRCVYDGNVWEMYKKNNKREKLYVIKKMKKVLEIWGVFFFRNVRILNAERKELIKKKQEIISKIMLGKNISK